MGQKLYAVYPGHIMARDGDRHFYSSASSANSTAWIPVNCINMGEPAESKILGLLERLASRFFTLNTTQNPTSSLNHDHHRPYPRSP